MCRIYTDGDLQGEKKRELPKKFSLKRRLRLLSGNGSLAEGSVVQLASHDYGIQHVARGLGALAETGTDDFDRNLGDLGGSSGSAVIVLLHDDFLLRKLFSEMRPENPQDCSFVFGVYLVELQVTTGRGHRVLTLNFPIH